MCVRVCVGEYVLCALNTIMTIVYCRLIVYGKRWMPEYAKVAVDFFL